MRFRSRIKAFSNADQTFQILFDRAICEKRPFCDLLPIKIRSVSLNLANYLDIGTSLGVYFYPLQRFGVRLSFSRRPFYR